MNPYEFTLVLDRVPSDDEIDALFESGCDDATPETEKGVSLLHFDREGESLAKAIVSAILDTEKTGLAVEGAQSHDLVSINDIATRINRSYESVRLMTTGQRGPGGFPAPLSTDSGWSLYSWVQVQDWYARNGFSGIGRDAKWYDREIAAADHVLRARSMLADAPVERANIQKLMSV